MNKIQFQKGMSLGVFNKHYGTVTQCEAALVKSRWQRVIAAQSAMEFAPP
jgi:hypothetical protein